MAKVLILEDDVAFGFQLKNDMQDAGYDVEMCHTASGGIEMLQHTQYDVLISDIIIWHDGQSVPDGGIKLISWVRGNPDTRTLPIVAMTGTHKYPGMETILTTVEQVGANASLEKPFHLDDLLSILDRLIVIDPAGLQNATPG